MALSQAEKAKAVGAARKSVKRRQRKPRNNQVVSGPRRNGQGRRRGGRRQRGGDAYGGDPKSFRTRGRLYGGYNKPVLLHIDEQIQIVAGSTTFSSLAFPLNPGSPTTFPMISTVAQKYERYDFVDLVVEYKPADGAFATDAVKGWCAIACTMDAKQSNPSSQQQAEIFHNSPVTLIHKPCSIQIPKKFLEESSNQKHFVRPNGFIPGGADPHLYDCGQFFFWVNLCPNTNNIGELRIKGSVRVYNLVLETSTNSPPNFTVSQFIGNAGELATTAVTLQLLFADVTPGDGFVNNLGIVNTAGSFVPPIGNYLVDIMVKSTNTGNGTLWTMSLDKNGVLAAAVFPALSLPSGANSVVTLTESVRVTANGTDAFTVMATNTFSTGTSTLTEMIRWTAV